jgi:hypothetical protein
MPTANLAVLQEVHAPVQQAGEVIAGVDRCLLVGLGRLGGDEQGHLDRLGAVFAGTPLAGPVEEALAGLKRRESAPRFGVILAAARAAVQGAQHDALAAQAAEALGRAAPAETAPPAAPQRPDGRRSPGCEGPVAAWRDSAQHWLMELAQTGFSNLDLATVAPFAATLSQLQDDPRLSRWAALLTGFHQELLHSLPVSALPALPVFRWADLWARALVGSLQPVPPLPVGQAVRGTLAPLGVDVRQHGTFLSVIVHAVLEELEPPRLVRITLSSYKVDALRGEEAWCCLDPKYHPLLEALADRLRLRIDGMSLLPAGDLLWEGKAKKGPAFPLAEWAADWLAPGAAQAPQLPVVPAVDRHPLQLAVPVFLAETTVESGAEGLAVRADGARLPLRLGGLGTLSALTVEQLQSARALLGLLRFDGGRWDVQPLAANVGRAGWVGVGDAAFEAVTRKRKKDTLKILRERASRLLRKKA